MSWFDTTGIAILAKNALKEAQKQIDKALDIKDEEAESIDADDTSICVIKRNDETLKRSSTQSFLSINHINESIYTKQSKPLGITTEESVGALHEQSKPKPSNAIELPSDSRCWNIRDEDNIELLAFRNSEADSSESKEVLTTAPNTTSTIDVLSQQSSCAIASHDDGASESVELIDTRTTSLNSTPTVSVDPCSSLRSPKSQAQQSKILPEQSENEGETASVKNDSLPYTLSEQAISALETCVDFTPITVAPCRSIHTFSLPDALVTNVVDVVCPTGLNESCKDPHHSLNPLYKNRCIASDTIENVPNECSNNHPMQSLQTKLLRSLELENSYENLELQTDSSLTHSFEEIKYASGIVGGDFFTTSSRKLDNSEKNSTASFESPVGLGANQSLFQSLCEDEIETTTSSDIEIISSPNGGDSSSTNSGIYRTSPLKISVAKGEGFDVLLTKKRRGHVRELSDISINSGNSDDSSRLPESEQLMRRLVEVSEKLEQREYRLVELGRQNAELNEQNAQLTAQLESRAKREGSNDLEGYMQRLSALERKFQQSIREKENLKCKLDALRVEADKKVAKCDVEQALVERDFMINELQKEGENLSKQVLKHSNIIKKLRAKEKECDGLIRKQGDEINEMTLETERLKRTLSAKDEVERSQIDAVHKLTSEKFKLERERAMLNGDLDDQIQKYETLRKSFEFARNELNDKTELCEDLQKRLAKLLNCENDFLSFQKTNDVLLEQLDELREQLRRTEQDYGQRLNRIKNEHAEVLCRLEVAELRTEEEKKAAALLTVPLMRQLESLQNLLQHKERLSEQRDVSFAQQLSEAVERIKLIAVKENKQQDTIKSIQSRITTLEERLVSVHRQIEETVNKVKQQALDSALFKRENNVQLAETEPAHVSLTECLKRKTFSNCEVLDNIMQLDCADKMAVLKQNMIVSDNEDNRNTESHMPHLGFDFHPIDGSPTASIGNLSLPESLHTIPWTTPEDDIVADGKGEISSNEIVGVGYNVPIILNITSQLENLQATLKQRDGEVYQLQWEVSRFHQERTVLRAEISNLTMELDNVRERFERGIRLEEEHKELQNRYDALLQMYGESVEKNEELQLDLEDVKEMYKIQIDELLQRQRDLISSINQHSSVRLSTGNNC